MTRPYQVLFLLSLIIGLVGIGPASGKVIDDGPQSLSQISSIGESLQKAGQHPLHILYVHGIGATGAGGSQIFQKAICGFLKDCVAPPAGPVARDYADSGVFAKDADPPDFQYMRKPVWRSKDEWSASDPFVDHYVLRRSNGGPIVVDEINWWPLVYPLKCRAMMTDETHLAGPNPTLLNLCSEAQQVDASNPGRFITYTWISPDEAQKLKTAPHRGALFNRWMKTSILDWGFSDAMMVVGSMHDLFREGMRQLFLKSVRFNANGSKSNEWEQQLKYPHGIDREFIVVSHSLGSYLVFSTLNMDQQESVVQDARALSAKIGAATEDNAAQYILERTSLVYFFANQVPLLELANLAGPTARLGLLQGLMPGQALGVMTNWMTRWEALRESFAKRRAGSEQAGVKPAQVIAWSDPSDLLSWHLPAMEGLVITNLYVHNTRWHWIIANPAAAHSNYATNKEVLRVMFGPKGSATQGVASSDPGPVWAGKSRGSCRQEPTLFT